MGELSARLAAFQKTEKITTKGKLAAILFLSRVARERGLPLNHDHLITKGKGQVQGLGKTAVQSILKDYGIIRVLAEEAGRTSRGSLGNLTKYVQFLNLLEIDSIADTDFIESWWVERIKDFFNSKPFTLKYDTSLSLSRMIGHLLEQAIKRQKENPGTMYAGALLQHLVGAKLDLALPDATVEHNGFSVADDVSARSGDFIIDDAIIHVTTAPGEAVMQKCKRNLDAGARPIIVTISSKIAGVEVLAENQGVTGRVEVLGAEQFIATNIYELSLFKTPDQKVTIGNLLKRYNEIIDECETDPSLKIAVG